MAITAPADTVSPAAAVKAGHDPGAVRGERLLHLHRFEDDDEIAFGDDVALGDGHLHDGALHGGGQRVAAGGRGGAAGAGALLGLGRLAPPPLPLPEPREAGRTTSRRLPPTSTTTRWRSPASAASASVPVGGPGGNVVDEGRLDPAGVDLEGAVGRGEVGVGHHREVERDDGGDALHHHFLKCPPGPLQGLGAGGAGDDQLGEHGVEVAADDVALLHAGVDADAGAGGVLQRA